MDIKGAEFEIIKKNSNEISDNYKDLIIKFNNISVIEVENFYKEYLSKFKFFSNLKICYILCKKRLLEIII